MLLTYIKDVDKLNDRGQTPLMIAALYGHEKCVQALIKKGANAALHDKVR